MPFTISHAGFVTPFRRHLSPHHLLALIIGSLVPDAPYYLRQFDLASFSHSIVGAIAFGLPLGYCLYRGTLIALPAIARILPSPHRDWLNSSPLAESERPAIFGISLALVIGALSHNFADSFTHESGAAVAILPQLHTLQVSILGEAFPLYRILQYSGSAIGIALLIWAYARSLQQHCRSSGAQIWQDRRQWSRLGILAAICAALATAPHIHLLSNGFSSLSIRSFGFQALITWLPLCALALGALAIFRPND